MIRILVLIACLAAAAPAFAVNPDEMLADPALEARAQALDKELRCVKCRSEAIASSNADWARDARIMVRELIAEGRTDDEVMAFFVERYGDYVRMRPTADGANLILWAAAPTLFVVALGIGAVYVRRRSSARPVVPETLSAEEEARLKEILKS